MIESKADLKEYIAADMQAMGCTGTPFWVPGHEVMKLEIALRKLEYYVYRRDHTRPRRLNLYTFGYYFWRTIFHNLSVKCGFDLHICNFGKGLNIHHRGTVVVNAHARIGDWCDLLPGVVIGQNGTSEDVPTLGNHVYVGTGAKIIGKVEIADDIAIGANAVVTHSFTEPGIAIAGVPARKVGMRKELQ